MPRSVLLLPILLACASLTVMAGATIAPGLPGLQAHFADQANADYLSRFILTAPGIAIAVSAPVAGLFADKLGRRVLLQVGVALYIVAGTSGFWLDDLYTMLLSRLLLGVAVGIIMVCTTALLTDHFQGAERDKAMGVQSSAMAVGGIVFIAIGSVLAQVSWRSPFLVYFAPVVLLPLIYRYVTKPPASLQVQGGENEKFPIGFACLIYAIGFVFMLLFYFVPTQVPFYIQELGENSPAYAGFAIVCSQIFGAIASAKFFWLRAKLGHRRILLISGLCMASGYLVLSQAQSIEMVYLGMPLIGTGLGFNFPNMSIWLMSRVPSTMRGRASGGLSTAIFLGLFLSPFLSQPMVNRLGQEGAFFMASLIMLVIIVVPVTVALMRKPKLV